MAKNAYAGLGRLIVGALRLRIKGIDRNNNKPTIKMVLRRRETSV
jgi:hypothetical protein